MKKPFLYIIICVISNCSLTCGILNAQVVPSINNAPHFNENNMEVEFDLYLKQFPAIQLSDTTTQEIQVFQYGDETDREIIDDTNSNFLQFVPFFRTYPIYKTFYKWGVVVCTHRAYSNEYTNIDYLELYAFDSIGHMLSHIVLPYFYFQDTRCPGPCSLYGELIVSQRLVKLDYDFIDHQINQKKKFQVEYSINDGKFFPIRTDFPKWSEIKEDRPVQKSKTEKQ